MPDADKLLEPQQPETQRVNAEPVRALVRTVEVPSEHPEAQVYERSSGGALRQGEILTGLVQVHFNVGSLESSEGATADLKTHPFAIVITQDCDVIQDYFARQEDPTSVKVIPNVLFCEADSSEGLRSTTKSIGLGSDNWRQLTQNKLERYQFLEGVPPEKDALEEGLQALGIDFKRYFTIPTDEVYSQVNSSEARRRCRLVGPYLQHFATRFFNYQSRVALPAEHRVK